MDVMELQRLNENEINIIIRALEYFVNSGDRRWSGSIAAAKILLENDAEFIRGLFWASEERKA